MQDVVGADLIIHTIVATSETLDAKANKLARILAKLMFLHMFRIFNHNLFYTYPMQNSNHYTKTA